MLVRRAITRPSTISAWRLSAQTVHSSIPRPNSQQLNRDGLWRKFRYRKDGQPRSRLAAAAFGSLIFFNALSLSRISNHVDESEWALRFLASVIYIQEADRNFNQVDLQDPLATLTHFKNLYQAISRDPPQVVDELFERLMKLGGASSNLNDKEGEAHHIMRYAAEQVHAAFQNLDQDSIANSAGRVHSVMRDALESLVGLVGDAEDDSDSKYAFQLIRDRSKGDGSVLEGYESLG